MKEYLQLARLHTAPLETVPAVVGAALATGDLLSWPVLIWGVYGFFYHAAGYAHNSCTDYQIGKDEDDPHKQHHPLNTGALRYEEAMGFVAMLMVGLALYSMAAISYYQDGLVAILLGVLIIAQIVFGVGYNILNNVTDFKFILITISHSIVFAVAYIASGGVVDWVFATLLLFVVCWVSFQISVSGEIKDITVDEANFMDRLGTEVRERTSVGAMRVYPSTSSIVWALVIQVVMGASLVPIILSNSASHMPQMVAAFGLYFIVIYLGSRVIDGGSYKRDQRVSTMAAVELSTLSLFVLAASPYLSNFSLILIPFSVAWVVVFNNIQWDTSLKPDV